MHGRLKIKTTAEKEAELQKKKQEKLKDYNVLLEKLANKKSSGELDDEALKLTEDILLMNPDHQTVWNTRKQIVLTMKEAKCEEEFTEVCKGEIVMTMACLRSNPKSYGSWYHRCWTLVSSPQPDWEAELKLCDKYLKLDERNFHCWDYRRWVVAHANTPPQTEFDFTTKMINSNFSNYSAWHNRSKLLPTVHPDPKGVAIMEESVHRDELELVQNAAFTDPGDSSAWFYLRWLLGQGSPRIPRLCFTSINEQGCLCLAFTQPVHSAAIQRVTCDGREVAVNWNCPEGKGRSNIWFTHLSSSPDANTTVVVTLDGMSSWTLTRNKQTVLVNQKAMPLFGTDFTTATSSVLNSELESCQQLADLEPDSKWVMLTMVLLMRALDLRSHQQELLGLLDSLARVDPAREGYYKDLKTKFTMEDRIEDLLKDPPGNQSTSFSGLSLTSLYHLEYLAFMKNVDVSRNCISQLSNTRNLVLCITVNLDDNCIRSTCGLEKLKHLETVYLRNNSISELEDLSALVKCPALKRISLTGNPVCDNPSIQEWLSDNLSHVEIID